MLPDIFKGKRQSEKIQKMSARRVHKSLLIAEAVITATAVVACGQSSTASTPCNDVPPRGSHEVSVKMLTQSPNKYRDGAIEVGPVCPGEIQTSGDTLSLTYKDLDGKPVKVHPYKDYLRDPKTGRRIVMAVLSDSQQTAQQVEQGEIYPATILGIVKTGRETVLEVYQGGIQTGF
jgi:hypothetical protein